MSDFYCDFCEEAFYKAVVCECGNDFTDGEPVQGELDHDPYCDDCASAAESASICSCGNDFTDGVDIEQLEIDIWRAVYGLD